MAGEENLINSLASFSAPVVASQPVATTPAMPLSLTEQKAPAPDLVEQKKAAITQNTEAKKLAIGGPEALMQEVVNRDQGLPVTPIENEFSPEGQMRLAQMATARQQIRALERSPRTPDEIAADTALGIIGGFGRTAEGLGALNTAALDALDVQNPLLRAGGRGLESIGGFVADTSDSFKTDALKAAQRLSQMEQEGRSTQSKEKYEAALEAGDNPLGAGLARVGRDAVSAIQAAGDNPATALDMVAENVPSLVVSAAGGTALARGAIKRNLLSKGATDDVAERFLASQRGQDLIRSTSIKMQPAMSGAQEAGGAATEAGQKIDAMTFEQLQANSPEYRSLLETMTPEQAKAEIRKQVVQDSTIASGILGTALGNVTKTFNATPFATTGIKNTAKNVVGETLQEGVMGAGGTLAQNASIKEYADENQDILEDVGKAAGEGMVTATGLTTATQAPGVVADTTMKGLRGAAELGRRALDARTAQTDAQIDADSAVTDEAIAEKAAPVYEAVDAYKEKAATPVEPVEGETPAEPTVDPILDKIQNTFEINEEEQAVIDPKVKTLVQDDEGNIPVKRPEMVMALARKFNDKAVSDEDKMLIATEIAANIDVLYNLEDDESNAYANTLDEADDARVAYESMKGFTAEALQQPSILAALSMLQQNKVEESGITEDNAATQSKIIAATAEANPVNVSPQAAKDVLDLARKRIIDLPESSVKALEVAIDISSIAKLTSDALYEVEGTNNPNTRAGYTSAEVTKQIVELGYLDPNGKSSEKKKSLVAHAVDIQNMVKTGRIEEAKAALNDATNFAISMNNKVNALAESSKQKGKGVFYDFWSPDTQEFINTKDRGPDAKTYGQAEMKLRPNNEGMSKFYRRVFAETSAAVAVQNTLALKYPELGIKPLPMPKLSQSVIQTQAKFNRKNLDALANFQAQLNSTITVGNPPASTQTTTGAKAVVQVSGVDQAIENGVGQISVTENGVPVPFKNFALSVEGNVAEVGMVERDQGARRGIGRDAYIALGEELASKGITLRSTETLLRDGRALWEGLAAKGRASFNTQTKRFDFLYSGDNNSTETDSTDNYEKLYQEDLKKLRTAFENVEKHDPNVSTNKNSDLKLWDKANKELEKIITGKSPEMILDALDTVSKEFRNQFISNDVAELEISERISTKTGDILRGTLSTSNDGASTYDENTSESWNGILVFPAIFNGMSPNEFKVSEISNSGMFQFAYITKDNRRIAGTFEYNDYEQFIDQFVVTSENGANSLGINTIRLIGSKLAKEFPKAVGLAGFRESGARGGSRDNPIPLIFDIKDGRLVLRKEGDQAPTQPTIAKDASKRDVSERYGDVDPEFGRRFKDRKETRSLIADAPEPANRVRELIEAAPPKSVNDVVKQKFLDMVPEVVTRLNNKLNTVINSDRVQRHKEKGADISKFSNLRASILTVPDGDEGRVKIAPQIAETAAVAGVSVAMGLGSKGKVDVEAMLEKQGIDLDGVPDPKLVKFMRETTPSYQVVANVSRKTMEMLGIEPSNDVAEADGRGVFENLSHEILVDLRDAGVIEIVVEKFTVNGEEKKFSGIKIKDKYLDEAQVRDINKNSDLLDTLINPEGERNFYIGRAPTRNQLKRKQNNTGLKLSEKQEQAISNQSRVAFTPNMPFLGLVDKLGRDAVQRMRGYIEITDEMRSTYNQNHLLSIEGKNQSIMTEIDEVEAALELMSEYAGNNDLDFEKTKIYYAAEITRVGRIQSVGPANGQSNKYARSALRSTWANIDLFNSTHLEGFWRSTLQMADLKVDGKKLEYLTTRQIMEGGPQVIEQKYGEVIRELEKHFRGEDFNPNIVANGLFDTEPKVLEALTAVARFNIASDEQKRNFRHSVPLESDGVTNGPAAVLVKFATGLFTPNQIAQFERVGLFFSKTKKTMVDRTGSDDTYSATANVAKLMVAARQKLLEDHKTKAHRDAVNRFIRKYNPNGVEVKDATDKAVGMAWELNRNAAKNPLTKTTYGAGINGTARGIAGEAMEKFYIALTNHIQNGGGDIRTNGFGYPELIQDLQLLTGSSIGIDKNGKPYRINTENAAILNGKNYSKLSLNDAAFESLSKNVAAVYVDPLFSAVKETMGSSFDTMQKFIRAAQIQSAVLQAEFDVFLKGYENNTTYSPKELKEWMDKFRSLGAYIPTDDQAFFVGGNKDQFLTNQEGSEARRIAEGFSREKGERFSTGFRGQRPTLAGVSAGAYINIGTGDALMMTLAVADSIKGMERTLQIYDGMEMPADKFKSIGEHMNKAALAAWNAPTSRDVLNSFEKFANQLQTVKLDAAGEKLVLAAMFPKETREAKKAGEFPVYPMDINTVVEKVLKQLQFANAQIEARNKARSDFSTWTDQMAGAASPYHSDGLDAGATHAEVAAALNERVNQYLSGQGDEIRRKAEPNERLTNTIIQMSEKVDGVYKVPVAELRNVIRNMSSKSAYYYQSILANNMPADLEVYYGTADNLTAMRDNIYTLPEGVDATPLDHVSGQYDPNNNVLYLVDSEGDVNLLGETLIHELTHVVISEKITNALEGREVTQRDRAAVQRLSALADDFLELDMKKHGKEAEEVMDRLRAMHGARGMDAKVLNEIIAEIITNPVLIPIAREKKINNKFLKLAKEILNMLKAMFPFMREPGLDYFSNAVFNVEILARNPIFTDPNGGGGRDVLDSLNPTGTKAAQTRTKIQTSVNQALGMMGLGNTQFTGALSSAVNDMAEFSFMEMVKAGFTFNPEEALIYRDIMNLFITDGKMNGPALVRAQEVYDQVLQDLSVESFEPTSNNRNDAQDKFNAVIGLTNQLQRDTSGKSLALPTFLALAQSNKEFADILTTMSVPKKAKPEFDTVDNWLASTTDMVLDNITNAVIGENKDSNARQAVDNLMIKLAEFGAEKQTKAEEMYQNTYSMVDEKGATYLERGSTALAQKIDGIRQQVKDPILSLPLATAQLAASIFSKKEGSKRLEAFTMVANKLPIPNFAVELIAEIRGRTAQNKNIYDMINRVRFAVQALREEFREQYPKLVQNEFTRKLKPAEWSAMHLGFGQTDVVSLLNNFAMAEIGQLFVSKQRRQAMISKLSKNLSAEQIKKANELADYMVNGKTSHMMMKNAYKISELVKGSNEKQIDDLISTLAVDKMPVEERNIVAELFKNENKGVAFALNQMRFFREKERQKNTTDPIILQNQWKGHIPSENGAGVSLVLAENSEQKKMAAMGYYRVGDYGGQNADYQSRGMSYYRTNVSSQNPYTQGVTQTVQASQNGIDIRTGRSVNGKTSGVITGRYVQTVLSRMQNQGGNRSAPDEHLLPVYGKGGQIVALERAIPPAMMKLKNRNTHFGEMLGAMGGRQEEERQAKEFNRQLIKEVKAAYDADLDRHDEYVNIAKSKDPIHKDTWENTIPRDMKDDLIEAFGQADFFPVRKEMIPMVVGYRNAGPSDLWTGVSRIPEPVQKAITETMTAIYGRKFYEHVMKASSVWTSVISELKVLIVVKSVVVPAMNLSSNIVQLSMRGVPMRSIATLGTKKFVEINKYFENQNKGFELQSKIRASDNDIEKARMRAQLENIKAANRRMSIWPLIEAGEFPTISEGLTDLDVSLKEGKFVEWVEAQVEKLPEGVRTAGRYAVVSKSTSLYKGLNRTIQYGDFLAKAILYDDMVNRRGLNQAQALGEITEEFVNYNIPAGRSRTFLENFGLAWFHNFKIRSLKPAVKAIRDNPLRAVMGTLMVEQFSFLGSPITDNVAATMVDGRFENSLGLGVGLRAPSLNPWYALSNG